MHRQRQHQFRCYESLPYIVLAVLILLYSGMWYVIITSIRTHSVQHINTHTPSSQVLHTKEMPGNSVSTVFSVARTDEGGSTSTMLPVNQSVNRRMRVMKDTEPVKSTVRVTQSKAVQSTAQDTTSGCFGTLVNDNIMVYLVKGGLVDGHVIHIRGGAQVNDNSQLSLNLWRNDKKTVVMHFSLRFHSNEMVVGTLLQRHDVFPHFNGTWGSQGETFIARQNLTEEVASFQASLYAVNSTRLVVQLGNITYKVNNYLDVPLQYITWFTVKTEAMKTLFRDLCVW